MAANSCDSDQYVDGSIDAVHLSANSVDSDAYVDGSIDEAHIANDAIDFAAHLKTGTDGELITWDAAGNPAAVPTGTATHVLTSGGAGVAPTFVAAAGGGAWTYLDTVIASGVSTVDFFALATSTYDVFACFFSGMHPSTDAHIRFRMQEAGGPSVDTGGIYYGFVSGGNNNAHTVLGYAWGASTYARISNATVDNWAGGSCDGVMYVSMMHRLSARPSYWGQAKITGYDTSMGTMSYGGSSSNADAQGFSGFQWSSSSGTISGTFRLYGLAKS